MVITRRALSVLVATLFTAFALTAAAWAFVDRETREEDQQKLGTLQAFVGGWKGVGQPKRGSTAGAWTEEAEWAWAFKEDRAQVAFQSPEGKYFSGGRIEPSTQPGELLLYAAPAGAKGDGAAENVVYRGAVDAEGQIVFTLEKPSEGRPDRITARLVAEGKRMLILYEKKLGDSGRYTRLAEVGYTRKGSGFGGGASFPECVVTGGYADREVEYMGKKYKVCCEGCRDLFEQDPAGVLADYRARKEKERMKNAQ